MPLTEETFITAIATLKRAYLNWKLPKDSVDTWQKTLAISIADALLLQTTIDWVSNKTNPPNSPAEIIKHGKELYIATQDSADTSAEILISSARNAYYDTDVFEEFKAQYEDSIAAAISGAPAQEAYIKENIRTRSSNPKILILVYDAVKGDLKDCFTGDAEHGIEFLRTQIKKKWDTKMSDAATAFLKSGKTDYRKLSGGNFGYLEA